MRISNHRTHLVDWLVATRHDILLFTIWLRTVDSYGTHTIDAKLLALSI